MSARDGPRPSRNEAAHLGTAVHRTIELLLKTEGLRLEEAWSTACDEGAASWVDPRSFSESRRVFLRLTKRLTALYELISDCGATHGDLRHELDLRSPEGLLEGRLDLLIRGAKPFIVDYKTGVALVDGEPIEQHQRQLAIYAWLVDKEHALDVPESALFSLRDGIVRVDTSRSVREAIVDAILKAQSEFNARVPGPQPAMPSDDGCTFCPFIGSCDEAWVALQDGSLAKLGGGWAVSAEVAGTVVAAANGLSAIPIRVAKGAESIEGLISEVPSHLAEKFNVGSQFRCWGLRSRSQESLRLTWRAGTSRLVHLD